VTWPQVDAELHGASSKIVVLPINGFAKEALDYKEHEAEGRNVIAVGGDKLSRGLTLEGLSISYFLRTSRMYDTLMQMGRWFGYRPGYLDLCRLFTTGLLAAWYRHIALADAELRREFDYMVAAGLTPEQYGLRVRTHPGGMTVTALNKMCHSQSLELSWAGVLVQSTQLPKDDKRVEANLQATERLLSSLSAPERLRDHETRIWRNVEAEKVATFAEALQLPPPIGSCQRATDCDLHPPTGSEGRAGTDLLDAGTDFCGAGSALTDCRTRRWSSGAFSRASNRRQLWVAEGKHPESSG
jgi:hypothetical protein